MYEYSTSYNGVFCPRRGGEGRGDYAETVLGVLCDFCALTRSHIKWKVELQIQASEADKS